MIFNRVKEDLLSNKKKREAGKYTSIPWIDLPKLTNILAGIEREKYTIITASPKVGKTQITDFLYLYQPYKFVTQVKSNVKLKIFYFSLEISKEQKIRQVIAHKLFEEGIRLSPQKMRSVFQDYILPDDVLRTIDSYQDYFEKFENTVTFIDNVRNSYGIYKTIRDYAEKNGNYFDKNGELLPMQEIQSNRDAHSLRINHYIPNNPDEYVIVITDHLSLMTPQKDEGTVHAAINNFSSSYCLHMRDRFKYNIVNVHQQVASQEELKFDNKGKMLIDKLRPSVDGLADSKYTSKDCNLLLGLFAPYRYKIWQYPENNGFNISKLQDNYRELAVILNRDGTGFTNLDLYFDGAVNYFRQLEDSEKQ